MSIARKLIPLEGAESFPFIFTITTISANTIFTLPIADYGVLTPLFSVNWGDASSGTVTSSTDPNRIHTFVSPGSYTITISGFMPSFKVNNNAAIRNLITGIVQFGNVGIRAFDFYGCINLTSIPSSAAMSAVGGYDGLAEMVNFAAFMRSTGLTSIPSDIFSNCPNVTTFSNAFASTQITSIPNGLFNVNTLVTDFSSCFSNCTSLSNVPLTLFDQNTIVANFSSTFRNCLAVSEPLQFTYNTSVTVFNNLYNMSTTANAMTGTAPTLWSRSPAPSGTDAFRNCLNLSNYASIPLIWK